MSVSLNAQIVDQRVRKLAEDYADALAAAVPRAASDAPRRRSAAFVALVAHALLDLDLVDAVDAVTDGEGDLGIDALVRVDRNDVEMDVYLFQAKYRQKLDSARAFPANEVAKVAATVGVLFDPGVALPTANPRLAAAVEEVRSLLADGVLPTVHVVLCSNGAGLDANGRDEIARANLPDDQVSWTHVGPDELVGMLRPREEVDGTIAFDGPIVVDEFDFRRVAVGKVPVAEVARWVSDHGMRLFERNVRAFLGARNRVNADIAATLRDPARRGEFYFLNNGVTVVCQRLDFNRLQKQDVVARLSGMQVVNGGQTAVTIERVLRDRPAEDFAETFVLVRVHAVDPERDGDLVSRVTLATNSQSPVELPDLRANDDVQRRLELGLKDLGYTYVRKRGQDARYGTVIRMTDAAEALLAVWLGLPHLARFNKQHHFTRYYARIFSPQCTPAAVLTAWVFLQAVDTADKAVAEQRAYRVIRYARHALSLAMLERALSYSGLGRQDVDNRSVKAFLKATDAYANPLWRESLGALSASLGAFGLDMTGAGTSLQAVSAAFRRPEISRAMNARIGESYGQDVAWRQELHDAVQDAIRDASA